MPATAMAEIVSQGVAIESVRPLKSSIDLLGDLPALRQQMQEDGYLYMPGLLHRPEVLEARQEICRRLAQRNWLAPGTDWMEAIVNPTDRQGFDNDYLVANNAPLMKVLHEGPLIEFFGEFLAEPVRYFDFTWFRCIAPGIGTASHCDIVYMGRGERERLYTVWTPLGDINYQVGGLMVLPGTHRNDRLKDTYGQMDVDTYCENRPGVNHWRAGGHLKGNPNQIARSLNATWHTTEYRAGDVMIFTMFTTHASLDNQSNRLRLSSDTRYQPASSAVDERWIGPTPVGHGAAGKKGKIC